MKDIIDEEINVFSATECTGLIPSLPEDEEEEDCYLDIMEYTPKKKK